MRLHRTMGNAQRCRHTPFARFLQMKPVTLPFRDRQTSLLKILNNTHDQNNLKTKFNQVLNDIVQHPKRSYHNLKLQKKTQLQIPVQKNEIIQVNSAPKNNCNTGTDWYVFTAKRRKNTNYKKKFTLSPKSYYALAPQNEKKESNNKKSPFLQLQKIIMEDEAQETMVSITPEKQDNPQMTESKGASNFSPSFLTQHSEVSKSQTTSDSIYTQLFRSNDMGEQQQLNGKTQVSKPDGTNVGMFTSTAQKAPSSSLQKNPSILSQDVSSNSVKVNSIEKQLVSFRYRLQVEQNSCNIALLAKQVTKLIRQIDPSMNILPFSSNDANDFLDHEDNLPTDEDKLKKWITNVKIVRDKLHFTMKYSLIKTIAALSGPVFSWMKRNSSYVKMDLINSEQVTCLGFFEGLHPEFVIGNTSVRIVINISKNMHQF